MTDHADFFEGVSSDGLRVLEAELGEEVEVAVWIARAREVGAQLLWIHTDVDLSRDGFERFPGYVRMRSEHPPPGDPLPRLEPEHYAKTFDASYRGRDSTEVIDAYRSVGFGMVERTDGWELRLG